MKGEEKRVGWLSVLVANPRSFDMAYIGYTRQAHVMHAACHASHFSFLKQKQHRYCRGSDDQYPNHNISMNYIVSGVRKVSVHAQ